MKMIKNLVIFTLLLITITICMAQPDEIDHWETAIFFNDSCSYFIGNTEPDSNWRALTFHDSTWIKALAGIGYADNDDITIIEKCLSVYIRIPFNIVDTSKIAEAIFSIDYDDAFVAYINDVEIARAGISGEHPPHDQPADTEHEALFHQGRIPDDIILKKSIVNQCLRQGDNVLAVQVHNISADDNDMTSLLFLYLGITDDSRNYRPTPEWFTNPYILTSSNLPIMVIDTEGGTIVDEPKTMAHMGIINNGPGQRNHLTDPCNEYDGWIGIEYRGNMSMNFPKKPFTFETRNKEGADSNIVLLDLPKENDFILRALFIDRTLMRDAIAYNLSRSIGRWAPRTRHVELVLNGQYQGIYMLVEKIKPDKNRLDIVRMDSSDIAGEALTGGYIWVVQQSDFDDVVFLNSRREGNARVLKYPKPDEVTPEQIAYIRQYEESFRNVMKSADYNNPVNGYPAYIDVSTFIDEIIIQETTANSDAYGWSSYFYKDRNGKMSAGPAWDFDQSLSNSTYNDGQLYDKFVIEKTIDWARPSYWDKLWADDEFFNQVAKTWVEYRQGLIQADKIIAYIDSVANYLSEAQARNFEKWPYLLGQFVWRETPGFEERDTFQKEVDYLKDFLIKRLDWLDAQFNKYLSAVQVSAEMALEFRLDQNYPNPFNSSTQISYSVPETGRVVLKVYNLLGEEIKTLVNDIQSAGIHRVDFDMKDLTSGIYFYEITAGTDFKKIRKMTFMK
ncbi:CotH kinase family protein [candidate division KSB1 bacterium]|nr:CotH kinase family protein [candidate division KSB1 bacterium]